MWKYSVIFVLAIAAAYVTADVHDLCEDYIVDLECVREYFDKNGDGKPVEDINTNPAYEVELPIQLSSVDLTVITTKTYLENLERGNMELFYYDEESDKIILSGYFPDLVCDAPDTIFSFGQDGEEPKIVTEHFKATYPVVLTVAIPMANGLNAEALRNAEYFAFLPTGEAPIHLGPKLTESNDPVIRNALAALTADINTALQDILRTKASYLFLAYIQNFISDFGLSPVLNKHNLTA